MSRKSKTGLGKKFTKREAEEFRHRLLNWYDQHGRILPWRYTKNQEPDPYRVWLSEIMLQQTTVAVVGPYFKNFTEKWPTVQALAAAPSDEIMNDWAGLGYYSRARNLHKCAQAITKEFGGVFPDDQTRLRSLPGIGDYTSAAIRAIAFNKPATVVDGNVERVMARYFSWPDPLPKAKKDLKNLAAGIFENYAERPGDLAQALMDLGATVCTPKSPRCGICPVSKSCKAGKAGLGGKFPRQGNKQRRPRKFGHVYWITNRRGEVLIQRRPLKGLLGGMAGLPTSEWSSEKKNLRPPELISGMETINFPTAVRHPFTHFQLELALKTCSFPGKKESGKLPDSYTWISLEHLENIGFPTVFKKAVDLFLR